MNYDFIKDYLRCEFAQNAYGPDKFDCFGLVWYVNKHHNGVDLPRFDDVEHQLSRIQSEIRNQENSDDWIEVTERQDFDIVVMRRAGEAHHVGVWLEVDGGRVLHATDEGIFCNDQGALARSNYQHFSCYRYANN